MDFTTSQPSREESITQVAKALNTPVEIIEKELEHLVKSKQTIHPEKERGVALKDNFESLPYGETPFIEHTYHRITSFAELLNTFPNAIPAARRTAKGMIKELKKGISSLSDFREICTTHVQSVSFKRQSELIKFYDELIDKSLQNYEKEIKKYQWQLTYLDGLSGTSAPLPQGDSVTPERIGRAKQFPISDLLEFRRGTVRCIFHDDTRPSLKYYPKDNHVYCFSCCRHEDAIGVAMTLWGVDFRTAVRRLAV